MSEFVMPSAEEIDQKTSERPGSPGTHPAFDRLVRTIWRLRQEDGCPWDKAQTHISIARNFIEETYEAAEAIEADDHEHMREEFGDVLEQVLLHAQIEEDDGGFSIDDICHDLNEKLVRRHPHVFGNAERAHSADAALDSWDEVKRQERQAKGDGVRAQGLLDSVPHAFPALMQCQKLSKRAAKAGFEWESVDDVWDQVASEKQEFLAEKPGSAERSEEFGDILFALVNVARFEGIDAEEALRRSNDKFRRRWAAMEAVARQQGVELEDLSTAELNQMWDCVKTQENHHV